MSIIFPNNSFYQMNFCVPYTNVYNEMKDMVSELIESRIIQKNLVYLIGLSSELIKIESKLKSFEYFGQYGKISKLVINKKKIYNSNGPNGPSYTCFITYSTEEESSLAILSLDKSIIDNHKIKANYGTTKYCLNFLKSAECKNKECIYLHQLADEKDIVSREQMNTDKDIFPQQRLMAIELSQILTNKKYKELYKLKDMKTVFPNGFNVYKKNIVINYIQERHLGISLNLDSSELIIEKNNIGISNKNQSKNGIISLNENKIINKEKEKEKEKEKKNIEDTLTKNKIMPNSVNLIKNIIGVKNSLNYLFKSAPRSRFNFVNPNIDSNEINQIIPSQLNDFVTQLFVRHSIYFNEEQNNLSLYYFALKPTYLDSNNSFSSLLSTLKKWNDINDLKETDMINRFNTY